MDDARFAPQAALLLRLALGGMWIAHGTWKVAAIGLAGLEGFLASHGLPAFAAPWLIAVELIGGLMILAGVHGRWVSVALSPILIGAMFIHMPNGFIFVVQGGGWEYPLFLLLASAVHVLLGDGAGALRLRLPAWSLRPRAV
jgi:putative oxidoreductase